MSHEDGTDPEDDVPVAPPRAPADPFERARAALRDAKHARGVDPEAETEEDVPLARDPQSVLARAAAAREQAAVGRKGLEREARAREELARLKGGGSPSRPVHADEDTENEPTVSAPRPRRL